MLDILLFLFLIVPLVHFIHESGHVFMARIYGVKGTRIVIGAGPKLGDLTIWGAGIRLNMVPFLGAHSTNSDAGQLTYDKIAWISSGGPIFNILSIMFVLPFWNSLYFSLTTLFIYFSLWIGLVNLIPFKIGHKKSDGWQIANSIIKLVKTR
jgi:hypothetical protein